jgi:hypothetical protein
MSVQPLLMRDGFSFLEELVPAVFS